MITEEMIEAAVEALRHVPSVWTRVDDCKESKWFECCRHGDGDIVDPIIISEHDTEREMKEAQLLHILTFRAKAALTAASAAASRSIESVPKGQDADGVPVRVCVAVTEDDEQWSAAGWHKSLTHNSEYYEMNVREAAVDGLGGRSVQFRWVEAVVRKYDASEPITRGVEVE